MTNYIKEIKASLELTSPLYIRVKINPQSSKTEIFDKLEDGTYKIRVDAPRLKNKANKALCKFLKNSFHAQEVAIVSGAQASVKLIRMIR